MAKTTKTNTNAFAAKTTTTAWSDTGRNPVLEANCKEDIDAFVSIKEQIKALEGALALHQANILAEAKTTFAARAFVGRQENIRLQSNAANVLFIVQDKSSAFSQNDYEAFAEKWGKKNASILLQLDYNTFKINGEAMKNPANAAKIRAALAKLQDEIGEPVLLPGSYKACEDIVKVAVATKVAKNEEELETLIDDLKITKYLRT